MDNLIGARLREERMRLGFTQEQLARIGGVATKQTQLRYESGERSPDADYLAAVAAVGIDVLYVITKERSRPLPPQTALPREHQALLNSYEMCGPDARKNLLQTAALLASGAPANAKAAKPSSGVKVKTGGVLSIASVKVER